MDTKAMFSNLQVLARKSVTMFALLVSMSSTASADNLRYLPHGDQSLMQMAELIKSAEHSIDLTYYIVDPCNASTKILLNLIQEKARQGVKVRMIIDAFTQGEDRQQDMRQSLLKSGIDLRYFNRRRLSPSINFRTHAKVLIADGKRYITGGRNWADDYFGLQPQNFIDRDVYVEGASASQAQAKFDSFWSQKSVYIPGPSTQARVDEYESKCAAMDQRAEEVVAAMERETSSTLSKAPVVQCSDVKFTLDDPRFWDMTSARRPTDPTAVPDTSFSEARLEKKETTQELLKFFREGTRSLVFENWSYIPTMTIDWILRELRSHNVPITVVTNRTTDVGGSVDVLNKQYAARDNTGSQKIMGLSRLGSMESAWSQTPKNAKWMIHSKVYLANNDRVAVTSFNLDPRSYQTNMETGLFVRGCPQFANQVWAETSKLIEAYERDKSCAACQENSGVPVGAKVKAWISHDLM